MGGSTANADALVLREMQGRVATVTLNRPGQRNTLSVAMMDALIEALRAIGEDRGLAAVVLRAEGPGFCAGHDLKEMQAHRNDPDGGRAFYDDMFAQCTRLMDTVTTLPQPVIAAVHGVATAAGCQLVAACDLAVAGSAARFGVNGIDVGFFCSTPMVPLSRNIGRKKALELLTTGRLMDAAEALQAGLVNQVVDDADPLPAARALAETIAHKSGAVIALGKQAFHAQLEMDLASAYRFGSGVMVENLMMRDCAEGFAAFIDKRKPEWKDR